MMTQYTALRQPSLRYLVMGGIVGGILFALGRYLMAIYLSIAAVVSAYGAAGSLVVLLIWIYFSSSALLPASVALALCDEVALRAPKPVTLDEGQDAT